MSMRLKGRVTPLHTPWLVELCEHSVRIFACFQKQIFALLLISYFWKTNIIGEGVKKCFFLRNISGIPKLYVKFWWPLFLAIKFTFLFLNLAKFHTFIPKRAYGGEGGSVLLNFM